MSPKSCKSSWTHVFIHCRRMIRFKLPNAWAAAAASLLLLALLLFTANHNFIIIKTEQGTSRSVESPRGSPTSSANFNCKLKRDPIVLLVDAGSAVNDSTFSVLAGLPLQLLLHRTGASLLTWPTWWHSQHLRYLSTLLFKTWISPRKSVYFQRLTIHVFLLSFSVGNRKVFLPLS